MVRASPVVRPGRALLLWFLLLLVALSGAPAPAHAGPTRALRVLRERTGPALRRLPQRVRQRVGRRHRARRLSEARGTPARLLVNPGASVGARLDLMRTAAHEINSSVYILADDRVGRIHMSELRAAARAGRTVRLLIDGVGSRVPSAALAALIDEGVQVGIYNRPTRGRLLRHPLRMARRMHDKLLIADGQQLVIGGRNLEEGYFEVGPAGHNRFDDIDVALEGPPAARANQYFMSMWNGPQVDHVKRADLKVTTEALTHYRGLLDRAEKVAHRGAFDRLRQRWRDEPIADLQGVEFLHGDPESLGNPDRRMHARMLHFIDSATSEVEILTPYLIPDRELLDAISRARTRGVTVRFVTNSLRVARGGERLAQWGFESRLTALARAGAEVWEVGGPHLLHAKTIVADRHRVWIGSYNQDPRSRHLQKEVGVVGDSASLAESLLARGQELRDTGLLAARNGQLTESRLSGWGRLRHILARSLIGPLLRGTGLYSQL